MPRLTEFRGGLKVLGHPLHAALVHLPMGLWMLVFPLSLAGWGGWDSCWRLAWLAEAAGLAGFLPAALAGAADLLGLRNRSAAAALANVHMMVMAGTASLFGLDLFLRQGTGAPSGGWAFVNLGVSACATALLAWGGWLGGELVYRHGAGGDPPGGREA